MTVLSGQTIQSRGIITPCMPRTLHLGMTYGLGPAGYDLRLDIGDRSKMRVHLTRGEFLLAATMERFYMPNDVLGVVHDKSTWARRGLCVQNTVIEPGWRGYLTLELTNHGPEYVTLEQGCPIAQVVFHKLDEPTRQPYQGKYQDQRSGPVPAL